MLHSPSSTVFFALYAELVGWSLWILMRGFRHHTSGRTGLPWTLCARGLRYNIHKVEPAHGRTFLFSPLNPIRAPPTYQDVEANADTRAMGPFTHKDRRCWAPDSSASGWDVLSEVAVDEADESGGGYRPAATALSCLFDELVSTQITTLDRSKDTYCLIPMASPKPRAPPPATPATILSLLCGLSGMTCL